MPNAENFRYMNFNFQILILWRKVLGALNYFSSKPVIIDSKLSSFTGLAM